MGPERKSAIIEEKNRKLVAYHEGGHAIVALYTPGERGREEGGRYMCMCMSCIFFLSCIFSLVVKVSTVISYA